MKTAGELWASCIRFLVIKTENGLLKRDEPKHVKGKTFLVASTLIIILLISTTSVSTNHFENWSFVEGLYAWFTALTTIGFGDYVHKKGGSRRNLQDSSHILLHSLRTALFSRAEPHALYFDMPCGLHGSNAGSLRSLYEVLPKLQKMAVLQGISC